MGPTAPDLTDVVTHLRAAGCVFAEAEAGLIAEAAGTPAELTRMVGQRAAGMPLEQVVGWAEFCGLRITVAPGVFVPRRRTEFLVRTAADLVRRAQPTTPDVPPSPVVAVDLCCGSGAVGLALAASLGTGDVHAVDPHAVGPYAVDPHAVGPRAVGPRAVDLHAVDVEPAAVRCARENLAHVDPTHATATVYEGDLDAPLPATLRGRVTVLTANVPYVPTGDMRLLPAEARTYEPQAALHGGADGLDVARRVAAAAPRWLAPGGWLLMEASDRQVPEALAVLSRSGLDAAAVRSADLEATVITGRWPGHTHT